MKHFVTTAIASLLFLGAAGGADAARPFGHTAKLPRAPKGFTPPAMSLKSSGSMLKTFPKARTGALSYEMNNLPETLQPIEGFEKFSMPAFKANAGGTNLFGYLNYGKGDYRQGWYEFTKDGLEMIWRDPLFTMDNGFDELLTSWVKDGRLCGFCDWYEYGYFWGQTYYEIDLRTGEVVTTEQDEDCIYDGGVFISACYDPEENVVYGYGTDDWDAEEVATATFQKTTIYPWGYEVIKDISRKDFRTSCKSLAYNPIDKNIYGITLQNKLVRIDKQTGDQTVIATLNTTADDSVTGMCYSTAEGVFYWSAAYATTSAALVTVNPTSGAITTVEEYNEGGESFGCLAEIGSNVTAGSPMRPEIVSYDFANGAVEGTFTIKLPTSFVDGRPITGEVNWEAKVDGRSSMKGKGAAGQEVEIEFGSLNSGSHTFSFLCEVAGVQGAEISQTLYIGSDIPKAPASVTLEKDNIHWTTVKEGINGGYIEPDNITYEVYVDGKLLETTARTTVKTNVGADEPFARHQASVRAVFNDRKSSPTYSNYLNSGKAWELPVDMIASQDMLYLCTTFNLDGEDDEENQWAVDPYRDPNAFYAGQADYVEGDDWLILPAMNFPDPDAFYSLYVTAVSVAAKYDSRLEVCIGEYPDPTSMDRVLIPEFKPQTRDYATYSQPFFKVPFAGEWYIGLHAKTGLNSCGVMVSEVRVENNNITPSSPTAVSDLTVTPGENGKLEATVSFKLPENDLEGNALPSTPITATVVAEGTTVVTGNPGETLTATVATVQGDNRISIALRQGDVSGETSYIEVYTGVTVPGTVKNLQAEVHADMMGVDFTWEAPDPEKKGGYVDPATVEYYFVLGNDSGILQNMEIGKGITSYSVNLPAGSAQDYYRVGIEARNVAGTTGRYMAITTLLGTPYSLPMSEDFEGEEIGISPFIIYSDENSAVEWFANEINKIATEWKDMEGVALCGVGDTDKADNSALGLPRFTTNGENDVTVRIKAWTGEQAAQMEILGAVYGMDEPVSLGKFPYKNSDAMDNWKTVEFDLPSNMLGQPWVQIYLDATFGKDHNYAIIDSIEVTNPSGVLAVINSDGSIYAGIGTINVAGFEGKALGIYSLDGKCIYTGIADGNSSVSVAPGIYVVKAGSRTVKLIVK